MCLKKRLETLERRQGECVARSETVEWPWNRFYQIKIQGSYFKKKKNGRRQNLSAGPQKQLDLIRCRISLVTLLSVRLLHFNILPLIKTRSHFPKALFCWTANQSFSTGLGQGSTVHIYSSCPGHH